LQLLKINLRDVKLAEDLALDEMADRTEGYSGADLTLVRTIVSVACVVLTFDSL